MRGVPGSHIYKMVYIKIFNDPECRNSLILNGRGERIRTSDPLVPNQVRYQTALRPEIVVVMLSKGRTFTLRAGIWDCACEAHALDSVEFTRVQRETGIRCIFPTFKRRWRHGGVAPDR